MDDESLDSLVSAYDYLTSLGFSEHEVATIVLRAVVRTLSLEPDALKVYATEVGYYVPSVAPFDIGPDYRNRN